MSSVDPTEPGPSSRTRSLGLRLLLSAAGILAAIAIGAIVVASLPARTPLVAAAQSPAPTAAVSPALPTASHSNQRQVTPAPVDSPANTAGLGTPEPTGYTILIQDGLEFQWSPEDAAAAAFAAMNKNADIVGRDLATPRIISVTASSGGNVAEEYGGPYPQSVVWAVHPEGTYFDLLPGQEPALASDGYIVYDDTGQSVAFGTFNVVH